MLPTRSLVHIQGYLEKQKAIFIRVSCCGLMDQGAILTRQQHLKAYMEKVQSGVHQGHSESIPARLRNLLYNP